MNNTKSNLMIWGILSSLLLTSFFNRDENQNQSQMLILKSQITSQVSSDNKELLSEIKNQYQKFSTYLKNGLLLDKLREESKNSPNVINGDFLTNFSIEYNNLLRKIKAFEQQLPNEQKNEVNNLISQLEGSSSSSDIHLKSIANMFVDGQLNKPEICQGLQIPLQVLTQPDDSNCGLFNQQTYTALTNFFQQENQLIKKNIDELSQLVETVNSDIINDNSREKTEVSENKSPVTLTLIALLLGLISLAIALINYLRLQKFIHYQKKNLNKIRSNTQQIKDLENRIQNYDQQIETFNRRIHDLKDLVNTQSLRLRQLESPHRGSNVNPNTDSVSVNNPSFFHPTSNNPSKSPLDSSPTIPHSAPENIRLAQTYQENPASLLKNSTQVGMTKDTTNKILGGVWEQIYLEENRRTGEYFIVTSNTGEMYLFLNPNSMFNPQTLSTIHKSQLFICHGNLSQSRKGVDITIQKPATVKKEAQYWVLVKSGEIILE